MPDPDLMQTAQDDVYCGFIKAKFAIDGDNRLEDTKGYTFAHAFSSFRTTDHFIYIALGHKDLPDNQTAIKYIEAIENLGGKITRLDFTIDIMTPFDFASYYEMMVGMNRGTPTLITSPRGDTVYIGRRSSARMLRLYNKRAEILARKKVDIGFDLTRIELEVKRDLVKTYKRLYLARRFDVIMADIAKRYCLPGITLQARKIKPDKIADRVDGPMAFVDRYKRVIRLAYLQCPAQFYEIIGVNQSDAN
ncbi:MAG: hypothetical protein PVH73_10460 [Candidatus Bathyarchaeota archaeon]